ncbi:hypothetical protein EMPS_02183 [Entomortierella parvispora]|uniref:3'-5' exonuclease n=1 Tax=Entomortierella parvispora TaxID=205924 RepID=A0A9P3LTD9_9FUNG|nr:hypothetical protein EMPS_02183 [Entomortierella parvispora]
MEQEQIRRVYNLPPVFLATTYEEAELMMKQFTQFYRLTAGSPGPVGFDTEITSNFITKEQRRQEVSLIQVATQDVCLLFQIYNIMGVKQKLNVPFPPRLKTFLEDPDQLLCGVGVKGDASWLRQDYNVHCGGLVDLSDMAAARNIPQGSLAALDEMFGRPGREVIKTKKILGWNWDKEVLKELWIWYAAKDAFSGVAIYQNMISGTPKSLLSQTKPENGMLMDAIQQKKIPLTEKGRVEFVLRTLTKAHGIGKSFSCEDMLATIVRGCAWLSSRSPKEQNLEARLYLQRLIRDVKIVPAEIPWGHSASGNVTLKAGSKIMIRDQRLSSLLRTREGLGVVKPFFNNRTLNKVVLSRKRYTTKPKSLKTQGDQDLRDLKMFMGFAHMWDQPRRLTGMVNEYQQANQRNQRSAATKKEKDTLKKSLGMDLAMSAMPSVQACLQADREESNMVWTQFMDRLLKRKVCILKGDQYMLEPALSSRLVVACNQEAPWILPPESAA